MWSSVRIPMVVSLISVSAAALSGGIYLATGGTGIAAEAVRTGKGDLEVVDRLREFLKERHKVLPVPNPRRNAAQPVEQEISIGPAAADAFGDDDTPADDDASADLAVSDEELVASDDELAAEDEDLASDDGTEVASAKDEVISDNGDLAIEDEEGRVSEDDDLAWEDEELAAEGEDDLVAADDELTESSGEEDSLVTDEDIDEPAAELKQASVDSEGEDEDEDEEYDAAEGHLDLFLENKYPSASTCGTCHPKHFKEWSVSQHAYAQMSPIYLSLNNRINELSNGSNGDFCLRCHSPVGANLGESTFMSNLDRHPASREGITCVVCHRIDKAYNKASGRLALVEGGLTDAVFGPTGNAGVQKVLNQPDKFRVVTDPDEPGRQIHGEAELFSPISTSTFCGTCHDVTLFNGFRLEEAFSEYRLSPAAARGETCQDCHMGKVQGRAEGYEVGPAAVVGEVSTRPRKITSHLFSGPDYSVIHPGIFPHNSEAQEFKTLRQWLEFKHEEGWGTDAFEDNVSDDYEFPEAWQAIDDRYDARTILNVQFEKLEFARQKRLEILKIGFLLGDVVSERADSSGLSFRVQVKNGTDGHNVPTGFTGERVVWLDVTVTDRRGEVVFRSGDRDRNGDLRDNHSSYVHAGKIERDRYLFSLQSTFVVQNGRGGELEQVIPIPYPSFALPRVLPSFQSLVFTGEPTTERNHKKGIEPKGERWASYHVDGDALTGRGPYKAVVKLRAQAVPVNLLIAMQNVGFDYGMTPRELGENLVAGAQTLWTKEINFDVGSGIGAVSAEGSDETDATGPLSIVPARHKSEVVSEFEETIR